MGVGGEKMPGIDTKVAQNCESRAFIAIFAQIFGPDGAARSAAKKIRQIMSRFSDKVREILPSARNFTKEISALSDESPAARAT